MLGILGGGWSFQSKADEIGPWVAQPCQQSMFSPVPASNASLACHQRDVTTADRRVICHLQNYSMKQTGDGASPAFNFFAVGGIDTARGCYALWFAPDQVLGKLQKFDDVTRRATGWTEPSKPSDDTTVVQFLAEGGRRCVGFQKMGEKLRAGAGGVTRTEGYYCEPHAGSGPLTNDVVQRYIALARLRGV